MTTSFRQLIVWQKSIELVKIIYQITESFPKKETYGLTSQMRRSAVSIPSNIAEGFKRQHLKEFKQFLNISYGSLGELETQVIISSELKYILVENKNEILEKIDPIGGMISKLRVSLKKPFSY